MTISVAIRIKGQAAGLPYQATAGEAITATLDSVAGVNSVQWTVAAGDDLVAASSYTLVTSGVKGENVAFNASATAGTALLLQAVVNADPTLYARAKVWVPAANGLETGADGEGYEGNATHGTTGIQNAAIRASGVGASTSTPTADTIAKWDASVGLSAAYFASTGTEATTGLLRAVKNATVAAARNAANGGNVALLATDGADKVTVGDAGAASAIDIAANGPVRAMIGASPAIHATEDGVAIGAAPSFGGGRGVLSLAARTTAPSTAPTAQVVVSNNAGALEAWGPKKVLTTIAPETTTAATALRLPHYVETTHTTNATLTGAIVTIPLPAACSFRLCVSISAQVTGTDTRAHYDWIVRGGRGGAGVPAGDSNAAVVPNVDAIGVAAVPTVDTDGVVSMVVKVTGKAATEIDWVVEVTGRIFAA